tara:strand:- start:481 stop:1185 length:705 start_codon:yes stop_codon:yes gene_type:complete
MSEEQNNNHNQQEDDGYPYGRWVHALQLGIIILVVKLSGPSILEAAVIGGVISLCISLVIESFRAAKRKVKQGVTAVSKLTQSKKILAEESSKTSFDISEAEERLYEQIAEEMAKGDIKIGLKTKALAESAGNEAAANALYIKYRAVQLNKVAAKDSVSLTENDSPPTDHIVETEKSPSRKPAEVAQAKLDPSPQSLLDPYQHDWQAELNDDLKTIAIGLGFTVLVAALLSLFV